MGQSTSQEVPSGGTQSHQMHTDGNTSPKIKPRSNIVVIPVDDTRESEFAFNWYVRNSHKEGNVVRLIHIHDNSFRTSNLMPDIDRQATETIRDVHANKRNNSARVISAYNKKLQENQINGSVHVEMGRPGLKILTYAKKHKASHIIMGRHGFGVIRRMVFGSVSQYVVDHSGIPVTVIPKETRSFLF